MSDLFETVPPSAAPREDAIFSPEQFARARALADERAAAEQRRLDKREARAARGGRAMTGAERVRRHNELTNDLPLLPAPADPAAREACRYDLSAFINRYAGPFLTSHLPAPRVIERIIRPIQESVLATGACSLFEDPRGIGKTTFALLGCVWALAYGHRRFIVLVSATRNLAKSNLRNLVYVLTRSEAFVADFPEIAEPILALDGKWQKAPSQTYQGAPTDLEWKSDHVRLATLIDDEGALLGDAHGATLYSVGVGGAVRGLNEMGVRPDLVLLDDIQKKKDAKSPALSVELENFIKQDVAGLFGHNDPKTILCTITPICPGDLASLLCDRERNPGWRLFITPMLEGQIRADLLDRFLTLWREDNAADDTALTLSTAFYKANRESFHEGVTLLDPFLGAPGEVDALHHVLLFRAPDERAFNAEMQMIVQEEGEGITITPEIVKHALSGVPEFILPPGITDLVSFCDVNIQAKSGMRYTVLGVGPGRVASVLTYGKYPREGRLFPEDTPDAVRESLIAAAVIAVGKMIAGQDVRRSDGTLVAPALRFFTSEGRRVLPYAMWFDGGNWTKIVSRACQLLKSVHKVTPVVAWSLGRNWKQFKELRHLDKQERGDHLFRTTSANGRHYIIQTDYWREKAQSGFLATPLTAGSMSLFGEDPIRHDQYASEVTCERLVNKFRNPSGQIEWNWHQKSTMNHYGDTLTGALACASKYGLYDSVNTVVDLASVSVSPRPSTSSAPDPSRADGADAVERSPDSRTFRSVAGGTVTLDMRAEAAKAAATQASLVASAPVPTVRGKVYRPARKVPRFHTSFKLR